MEPQNFYDIEEQNRYWLKISKPDNVEELGDNFVTKDELEELSGQSFYWGYGNGSHKRVIIYHEVIRTALNSYTAELEANKKARSIRITDHELLEVIRDKSPWQISDYVGRKFCRHGDRIRYSAGRRRKKTKATRGDVANMWYIFHRAFHDKFKVHMPWVPMRFRYLKLFNVYKKLIGWRACRKHMNHTNRKFYRQIWDNPEEFMS